MSKLIRHTQKRGTALFVALQLTALTVLSLVSFVDSPQQSPKAAAETQVSAPVPGGPHAGISSDQDQTQADQAFTAKDLTAADKSALRQSAHFATKLQEPLHTQIFNLAMSRAESAQQPAQGPEVLSKAPLTTDREDYPPFSYVY